MRTPAARLSVVLAVPSPQFITTVWVSSVPGSVKLPVRVTVPPTFRDAGAGVTDCQAGATLFTATLVVPLALALWLSVTVALML